MSNPLNPNEPQQPTYGQPPQFQQPLPPQGYAPQPPRSPKTGRVIALIAGGVVLLLIIGIVGILAIRSIFTPDAIKEMRPETSTSAPADPTETPTEPTSGNVSLDNSVEVASGEKPAWSVPLLSDGGWETTAFDQNGINAFSNTETGCALITSQNVSAYSSSDANDSVKVQEEYITAFVGSEATNVESRNIENVSISKDVSGSDTKVEYLTSEVTYFGNDGVDYRMILSVRNFSNVPASTAFIYVCPTANFDVSEYNSILDKTAITFFAL